MNISAPVGYVSTGDVWGIVIVTALITSLLISLVSRIWHDRREPKPKSPNDPVDLIAINSDPFLLRLIELEQSNQKLVTLHDYVTERLKVIDTDIANIKAAQCSMLVERSQRWWKRLSHG